MTVVVGGRDGNALAPGARTTSASAGVPVRIRTVHDAFESYARQWMRASDWWHQRGGRMTRAEWHTVAGSESRTSNEIYDEITRE